MAHTKLPLAGVRVVEFGQYIAAPGAAMLLADLGAEVIKVEGLGGDSARVPDALGHTPMFLAYNRHKRSVALDLRNPQAIEAAQRLALSADVVLHNTRVGVMERIGLDAASLRARKPGLIHASITGFGRNGPSRSRPGLDIAAQAESGLMSVNGELGGGPLKVGFTVVDVATASATANAILAALFRRAMQGEGDTIEVSLLAVAVQLQAQQWAEYHSSGKLPQRVGNCQPKIAPAADVIAVADGHLVVSATTEGHWQRLCTALNRPDLASDPRFARNAERVANRPALLAELSRTLGPMNAEAARELLEQHNVVVGVVRNHAQVMASPDVQATGIFTPVALGAAAPIQVPGMPFAMASIESHRQVSGEVGVIPQLGEHTEAVLAELDFSRDDIAQMRQAGAIGVHAPTLAQELA